MLARTATRSLFLLAGFVACIPSALAQDVTNPGDPITGSSTNVSGDGAVTNAIDNTANTKYLNFDKLNTGFTVTPSGSGIVHALILVTANDQPPRDPASFTLEGSNDGSTFTLIAQGNLSPPTARFAFYQATFPNSTAYLQYRVLFPTVRTAASANSMQIAEVQLSTLGSLLTPGDGITATFTAGASSPVGQGATGLIDGSLGTKFNVVGGNLGPTTVDILPAVGPSIVSGLDIFGAADDVAFPNRVPTTLTLLGSNDGTNYTQIFTTGLSQNTANYQDQQFSFANTIGYSRYRLVLGPSIDGSMQLGEILFLGTALGTAPGNDNCATPQTVTDGSTSASNINATGSITSGCGTGDTADVWFRYVAAASGVVEVNTCGPGTLDTTLGVYASCSTLIGCNDNACFGKSRVRFQATGGTPYLFRVAGVGGTTGSFTLNVVPNPVLHTDVPVVLAYNFNGMAHVGEANDPDNPDGFRSLSDRAIRITGTPGSLDVGAEGVSGIPYTVVTHPGALDLVQLGDRNTCDSGNHHFDAAPNGDNVGVEPNWLLLPTDHVDQSGPQTTPLTSLNLAMGANTRIGLIANSSNGGTAFTVTLGFTDGSSAGVTVTTPDWFGAQTVAPPAPGVETQASLGLFFGTSLVDSGTPDVDLNVVEAVIGTQSLLSGGFGDFTGRQLASIAFSNAVSALADTGIYAVTIRDATPVVAGGACCSGSTCLVVASAAACTALNPSSMPPGANTRFVGSGQACNAPGNNLTPCCKADFNQSGAKSIQDLFDFLAAWFAKSPQADINGNPPCSTPAACQTAVTVQDLFDFLAVWFPGC